MGFALEQHEPVQTPLPPDMAAAINRITRNVEGTRASIDFQLGGTCATLQNVLYNEFNAVHANVHMISGTLQDLQGRSQGTDAQIADLHQQLAQVNMQLQHPPGHAAAILALLPHACYLDQPAAAAEPQISWRAQGFESQARGVTVVRNTAVIHILGSCDVQALT